MSDEPLYEKLISENEAKGFRVMLVVNEFRDKEYLHLRKYFLSFDEGYVPSKEGISVELTISNSYAILEGMIELCSKLEGQDALRDRLDRMLNEPKDNEVPELSE